MSQSHAISAGAQPEIAPCRDRIEEQIIRAYVRLALAPDQTGGLRTITLTQFGALEIRLTEVSGASEATPFPPFWVEIYSHESSCVIDSCGCFEFDEDELTAAVDLVVDAQRHQPVLN
ncbi:hypothetical protein [Microvirga subterranea]|uniref:Uncharacterized protein n=1 Tax=Microvirga subterranea TaxID=186651 RepID=A0A370HNG1_9HYPH|nr:hypothetical protein [Microvirga subterranea]RDI60069.1 hypothetical protein DES45_103329 [Microvirga subterranea]